MTYSATSESVTFGSAPVSFVFDDSTPPTNTITLASATGAHLSGTTLYYRPAAAGSLEHARAGQQLGHALAAVRRGKRVVVIDRDALNRILVHQPLGAHQGPPFV